MPYDTRMLDSAWLAAQARFEQEIERIEAAFYRPEVDRMARMLYASLTPQQRAMLPGDVVEKLNKRIGGM